MYNLIKKIADNEKIILSFVFIGIALILLDILTGFQGMKNPWSDIWHHRAVLVTLAENPFNPSNPHILSEEGSRSFIPIYIMIGYFASLIGFSANTSLAISSLINLALLVLGAKYFTRALGSKNYIFLLFILFFAWLYPPNYTGFHNLRTIVQTNAFPAAHSFGLTLIIWGMFIETIKKPDLQLKNWLIITALLTLNVLSHQLTALFCIGGLFVFIFIPTSGYISSGIKTISAVITAVILTILWPYFDVITVLSSASNSGWDLSSWFYDPVSIVRISLPAIAALAFLFQVYDQRYVKAITICAIGTFTVYLGTHFIGIGAGHRVLPYWIFFLQIILFIALQPKLAGNYKASIIEKMKPIFICCLMIVALGQCLLSIVDMYKPTLRNQYGWTFLQYEPGFFYEAMEKIKADLPDNSNVVALYTAAYPIQGFGIPVVSIPRQAPMISDLNARQAATKTFFKKDLSCEERLLAVKPYAPTHAAYAVEQINNKLKLQISELGNVVTYDGLISIVKIPDVCPVAIEPRQ